MTNYDSPASAYKPSHGGYPAADADFSVKLRRSGEAVHAALRDAPSPWDDPRLGIVALDGDTFDRTSRALGIATPNNDLEGGHK